MKRFLNTLLVAVLATPLFCLSACCCKDNKAYDKIHEHHGDK